MAEEQEGKKRHRSPAYPAVGLREAVVRLRKYYQDQKKALVHLNSAYESLGYKAGSSSGARLVAALISYGLLIDEGTGDSRKVRITDLGFRIAILDEDAPERQKLILEAAKRPKLYADLLGQWPESLPSDSAIRNHLLIELNFNDEYVQGLIKDFRDTYEFAGLGQSGPKDSEDADEQENEGGSTEDTFDDKANQSTQKGRKPIEGTRSHTIPLSATSEAILIVPSGITSAQFNFLKKYLTLMEEAITGVPPGEQEV